MVLSFLEMTICGCFFFVFSGDVLAFDDEASCRVHPAIRQSALLFMPEKLNACR